MSSESASHPKDLCFPSRTHQALALIVICNKPASSNTEEYLSQLRSHFQPGRREGDRQTARHVEAANYWRDRFKESQAAREKADCRISALEQEIAGLQEQLNGVQTTSAVELNGKGKRKAFLSFDPRPTKSQVLNRELSMPANIVDLTVDEAPECDRMNAGPILTHHIFLLHKACIQDNDHDLIAHQIGECSSAIRKLVLEACSNVHYQGELKEPGAKKTTRDTTTDSILDIKRAVIRTYELLLQAFAQLQESKSHNATPAMAATHSIASLFGSIYECAEECLKMKAAARMQCPRPKRKSRASAISEQGQKELDPIVDAMWGLVQCMLARLSAGKPGHSTLFEAYAFIILQDAGQALYVATFGHERETDVEDNLAKYRDTVAHEDAEMSPESVALKVKAPFIIDLLGKVIAASPAFLDGKHDIGKRTSLTQSTKETLQQTLINGTFAVNSEHDSGLADYLRMPAQVELQRPKIKNVEIDAASWFIDEAWKLLGWDILRGE